MKQPEDSLTMELPLVRRRGPKASGKAMTNAERQRAYRARHVQVDLGDRMAQTVRDLAEQFDLDANEVVRQLVRFALTNRNWKQCGFDGGEQ